MKYSVSIEIETEKSLSEDIMDCIVEDMPDAVMKIAENIFGSCTVTDCKMKNKGTE